MSTVVAYSASFDPPTRGHVWISKYLLENRLADQAVLHVATNASKIHLLTRENAEGLTKLTVGALEPSLQEKITIRQNLSDLVHGFKYLARGIRDKRDYDEEIEKITETFKQLAQHGIRPLPVMYIYHGPIVGQPYGSSTDVRNILFSEGATLGQLEAHLTPKVAEILFTAYEIEIPHRSADNRKFNESVAQQLRALVPR